MASSPEKLMMCKASGTPSAHSPDPTRRQAVYHDYFPYIDGMRAVAVCAVIAYHLHPAGLPGGFAGVDVFFVISGFVVSAASSNLNGATLQQFALRFYARRMKRLLPALIFCLVATTFVSLLFIPPAWLSNRNELSGLFAFYGASNLILSFNGDQYFAPINEFNPYTHTWSLGVEEQFYVLFPLLFFPWVSVRERCHLSVALFCVGAVGSILLAQWLAGVNPVHAFYMLASRFWEMALGVLLYQCLAILRKEAKTSDKVRIQLATVGAPLSALLVVASLFYSKPQLFPFPGAVLAVTGTAGLLFFMHGQDAGRRPLGPILTNRPIVFLGRISYSLYLWHWPVLVLFRWTVGLDEAHYKAVALIVTLLFAMFSFFVIEKPARNALVLTHMSPLRTVTAGFVLIAFASLMALAMNRYQPWFSLSMVARNAEHWYPQRLKLTDGVCTVHGRHMALNGTRILHYYPANCEALANRRIYVIGDSHAGAYIAMFKRLVTQKGIEVIIYSNGGCPFLPFNAREVNEERRCALAVENARIDALQKTRPGDVLFLPSLRLPRFVTQWDKTNEAAEWNAAQSHDPETVRKRKIEQAIRALEPFAAKHVHIVFPGPTPVFRSPPFRCADWFNRHNPICEFGDVVKVNDLAQYRMPVLRSINAVASSVSGVFVWDPFPILCSNEVCKANTEEHPLFFDGDHLSGHGNELLFPHFSRFIERLPRLREH